MEDYFGVWTNYNYYINFTISQKNLARRKEGKAAADLYQQAFDKFEKAIEIKPKYYKAFNNWGNELSNLAKTKKGKAAKDLYQQAFVKFEMAMTIEPKRHIVFYAWGTSVMNFAKTKKGKAAEDLYQQAFVKFEMGVNRGGKYYNFACLHAVQNNKEEALRLLKVSLSKNEETVETILKDEDWKPYLEDEDFKAIIKIYKK